MKLIIDPAESLHRKSKEIHRSSHRLRRLGRDMLDLMRRFEAVGLAAPQVGYNVRLIVIGGEFQQVMFNPRIGYRSKETFVLNERCLSLPGECVPVERHHTVTVYFEDEKGKPLHLTLGGLFSAVVQHEIDHLDGILMTDRMRDAS